MYVQESKPAGEPSSLECDLHIIAGHASALHRTAESSCNRNWKSVNCPALSWEIWQPLICVFVEADKPVSKTDMENKRPKNSQTLKKKNKLQTSGNVFRVCSEVLVKTSWREEASQSSR